MHGYPPLMAHSSRRISNITNFNLYILCCDWTSAYGIMLQVQMADTRWMTPSGWMQMNIPSDAFHSGCCHNILSWGWAHIGMMCLFCLINKKTINCLVKDPKSWIGLIDAFKIRWLFRSFVGTLRGIIRARHTHIFHTFFSSRDVSRVPYTFFLFTHFPGDISQYRSQKIVRADKKMCQSGPPHKKNRALTQKIDRVVGVTGMICTKFLWTQGLCALTRKTGSKFEQHFETLSSISTEFLF